jgi:hypothetical protein
MVAQGLAKEVSKNGVHVVHAIANGGIKDEDSVETRTGYVALIDSHPEPSCLTCEP